MVCSLTATNVTRVDATWGAPTGTFPAGDPLPTDIALSGYSVTWFDLSDLIKSY